MKKTFLNIALASAMFLAGSNQVMANDRPVKEEKVYTESELERFKEVESRIMEIKEMNFSEMSKEEKKDVRAELKALQKEAKQNRGSGLYISTGALIIIVILLIILL
jgi:hypothetical protein